jgi:hypothetical protein
MYTWIDNYENEQSACWRWSCDAIDGEIDKNGTLKKWVFEYELWIGGVFVRRFSTLENAQRFAEKF